jgi:hypothetical protein
MVGASVNSPSNTTSSGKWLYVLLVITLALVAWTAFDGDSVQNDLIDDKPMQESSNNHRNTQISNTHLGRQNNAIQIFNDANQSVSGMLLTLEKPERKSSKLAIQDIFKVLSWAPVVVLKKELPIQPSAPEAPPVPFSYVGKLEDSPTGTQVFLMANSKLYTVQLGHSIDQEWRLDSEDANTLTLTYLPLNLTQSLSKAAKQPEAVNMEMNQ